MYKQRIQRIAMKFDKNVDNDDLKSLVKLMMDIIIHIEEFTVREDVDCIMYLLRKCKSIHVKDSWLCINEDMFLCNDLCRMSYIIDETLKLKYPKFYITCIDTHITDKNIAYIVRNLYDYERLIEYIQKVYCTLDRKKDVLSKVAYILHSSELITGDHKDIAYNIKDNEQYTRHMENFRNICLDNTEIITEYIDGILEYVLHDSQ